MINASELREGNIVTVDDSASERFDHLFCETLTVTAKSVAAIQVCRSCGCCYENIPLEEIAPIELTDEWLDKFGIQLWQLCQLDDPEATRPFVGFKLSENLFLQKNYCRNGSGRYDGYLLVIKTGVVFRAVWDCLPIKTVHRLQNIVFALLGQELVLIEPL